MMMIGMKRLIANDDSHKKNPMIGNCTKAHRAKILDEMKNSSSFRKLLPIINQNFLLLLVCTLIAFFSFKKKIEI
jgi:hypothetical protein